MSKPTKHYRLLVDVQYPPHPAPIPAGAVVDDYPVAAVADDLAQGWIAETDDPVTPLAYVFGLDQRAPKQEATA